MPPIVPKGLRPKLRKHLARGAGALVRRLDPLAVSAPVVTAELAVASKPSSLSQAMLDAPRYRTAEDSLTFRSRLLAVVCSANEVEAALRQLEPHGAKVRAVVLYRGQAAPALPDGCQLIGYDELARRPELVPVVYGIQVGRKVVELAQHGIRHLVFAKDPGYHPTVRYDPAFYEEHRDDLEWLFGQLADEESRNILAGIVRMRTTGDYGFIRVSGYPEYDHPLVRPATGETVLDLGMETAHTSLRFAAEVGDEGRVFGFEASPEHWDQIQEALDASAHRNVEMIRKGVWNENSTLSFVGGKAGASRVTKKKDPQATLKVPVMPIDDFVRERGIEKVGLLSFDVEGAEPQALEGARKTVERDHPKLQISIYHRMSHLFELPKLVASFGRPYRFYMGHHSAQGLETDLYALPV